MARETPRRPGGRNAWLTAAAVLILAGMAVPYGVLGGRGAGLAVAGFWLGFGLAVVALIWAGVRRWRD